MIENWRKDWKRGDFPFLFVQLAPFKAVSDEPMESDWAELREAQAMTLRLPNTGMAVITDFGSEQEIHPMPKEPVGSRLALIAEGGSAPARIGGD
jgi:sialate O-acetylesterase